MLLRGQLRFVCMVWPILGQLSLLHSVSKCLKQAFILSVYNLSRNYFSGTHYVLMFPRVQLLPFRLVSVLVLLLMKIFFPFWEISTSGTPVSLPGLSFISIFFFFSMIVLISRSFLGLSQLSSQICLSLYQQWITFPLSTSVNLLVLLMMFFDIKF